MLASNLAQLAKLKARFDAMASNATEAIVPSLDASAGELVAEMQRLAPHRSGALAESIAATPAGQPTPENALGETRIVPESAVAVTAGDRRAFYASKVEFGTSKAHAQPFFLPAYRALRSKITGNLKDAVTAAVKGGE